MTIFVLTGSYSGYDDFTYLFTIVLNDKCPLTVLFLVPPRVFTRFAESRDFEHYVRNRVKRLHLKIHQHPKKH